MQAANFYTKIISVEDDLAKLIEKINQGLWDEGDLTAYDVDSLKAYLVRQDTVFLACYNGDNLVGIASSRIELKPYGKERWLYIDEVDVCVNYRKLGAGKLIMKTLLNLAKEKRCTEVWLGTELDNVAANALYQSLSPDEVEKFIGYTYEFD